jgi:hypothetical protein
VYLISFIMFWASVGYLVKVSAQALIEHTTNKGKDK